MNNEKEIIDTLDSDSSEKESFFGFCYEEHYQDNEHIKANRDGLIRFASFLLRIAYNIEPKKSESSENVFPIDQSFSLPNEGLLIHYIKLIDKKKSDYSVEPEEKTSWKDQIIPIGCIGIVILFIISGIIGIGTIIQWLF